MNIVGSNTGDFTPTIYLFIYLQEDLMETVYQSFPIRCFSTMRIPVLFPQILSSGSTILLTITSKFRMILQNI